MSFTVTFAYLDIMHPIVAPLGLCCSVLVTNFKCTRNSNTSCFIAIKCYNQKCIKRKIAKTIYL